MPNAPVLFVTGKGGCGKTTVSCGLALALARRGERVLLVEPALHDGIAAHFGDIRIASTPTPLGENLFAAHLESREMLEAYFARILRLPFLARRLLSSSTFNAVTSAAPGISEFLALDQLHSWSEGGEFDRIVFDSPATGHALQLLKAPSQLASIASRGPLFTPLRRILNMLADPGRTSVALVSLCQDMSVAEITEAHSQVSSLGIRIERPILNRCAERRFTEADIRAVRDLARSNANHPLLRAAEMHIAAQKRANRFATALRRTFDRPALRLSETAIGQSAVAAVGLPLLKGIER